MKLILLVSVLCALIIILSLWRFHHRYGTRAERKVLEDKLHKDLMYLHSDPFTSAKSVTQTTENPQSNTP
jgi:hypothetical protein